MRKIVILLFMVLALNSFFPNAIFSREEGDDIVFDVEGSALIKNDDLSRARNDAIQDALLKAVEQATGKMLTPKVMAEKAPAVKADIFAKSEEYIKNYRMLSEKASAGAYTVGIKATVDAAGIENDLRILGFFKNAPGKPSAAPVTIILREIKRYTDYVNFREFIRTGVKGVDGIRERRIEWGTAKMEADIQGGLPALAAGLAKAKQFAVQVTIAGDSVLDVVFLR